MRDQANSWVDFQGVRWPLITSKRRLRFKNPAHAALRRHVHHRDGFQCVRCGLQAIAQANYCGRDALRTNRIKNGFAELLVIDHIVTLKAGGLNRVENLQTLCETCNLQKMPEDALAVQSTRGI
jgi:5-methylcytosine-specific restriction endonuclease McrA